MSSFGATEERPLDERDDQPHEHGGEPGWSERLAFNFFDVEKGIGGVASMEFWPGSRRAESAVHLFLRDGSIATALGRARDAKRSRPSVGRLTLEMEEQGARWRVRSKDVALVMNGESDRGTASPIHLDLAFEAWAPPTGWGTRRTEVDEQRFLSIVSTGFFEQPGRYTGSVSGPGGSVNFEGLGFRERVWGVREWSEARPFWYAAAFGPDLSLSFRHIRFAGDAVTSEKVYERERIRRHASGGMSQHFDGRRVEWVARDVEGLDVHLTGKVLVAIDPRPGEAPVGRSMVRFHSGGRETLGFVEQARPPRAD